MSSECSPHILHALLLRAFRIRWSGAPAYRTHIGHTGGAAKHIRAPYIPDYVCVCVFVGAFDTTSNFDVFNLVEIDADDDSLAEVLASVCVCVRVCVSS